MHRLALVRQGLSPLTSPHKDQGGQPKPRTLDNFSLEGNDVLPPAGLPRAGGDRFADSICCTTI